MSTIEQMKCDHCGTYSKDICGDPGWISFNWVSKNGFVVAVSAGRQKGGNHYEKSYKEAKSNVDFCSVGCMLKWMDIMPTCNEPKGFIIVNFKPRETKI